MRRVRSLGQSAALLLTFLGLSSALGTITHCRPLSIVASVSAASPLPLVFGRQGSSESVRQRFALTIHMRGKGDDTGDAGDIVFADGREVAWRIAGPFHRRKIYLGQLLLGRLEGPSSIVAYGLCDGGPLARDLGVAGPVRGYTVTRWYDGEATPRVLEATCP